MLEAALWISVAGPVETTTETTSLMTLAAEWLNVEVFRPRRTAWKCTETVRFATRLVKVSLDCPVCAIANYTRRMCITARLANIGFGRPALRMTFEALDTQRVVNRDRNPQRSRGAPSTQIVLDRLAMVAF